METIVYGISVVIFVILAVLMFPVIALSVFTKNKFVLKWEKQLYATIKILFGISAGLFVILFLLSGIVIIVGLFSGAGV